MESKDTAKCKYCQETFKKDNAGVCNVISHSQGNIHKSRINTASSYSTLTFKTKAPVGNLENLQVSMLI